MSLISTKIKYIFPLRLITFWLLFFAYFRILFISYNFSHIEAGHFSETLFSFLYALRLDLATACIASIFPFILWALQQFFKIKFIHTVNRVFNIICIAALSLLSIANVKIYKEWGVQITARALAYVRYPQEMVAFISTKELALLIALIAISLIIAIKVYLNLSDNFSSPVENFKLKIFLIIITPLLLIIGARGGVQLAPVNESSSYYSNIQFNNHAATNNIWFLMHSIEDAAKTKNIYSFMNDDAAKKIRDNLFKAPSENTSAFLKTNRPNIVIIVLESWTADLIEALGGEKNVTPHFNELTKEGILFTQMYSSGFRTEQGLISLLSGFPSQPNHSIINSPSKSEQLPSVNFELEKQGYQPSFYYGGEIEFANMKSYLLNTHFKKIIDKHDFKKEQCNSKWGAHDEFVLTKQLDELKSETQPFFQ